MGPLVAVFLFVLVDVLGFSLVLPLLPFLREEFGMSPLFIGAIQSSNAVAQLLAVPVLGGLSDRYGRKPLLLVCVLGTFVSFVLFATARSPWVVLLSRVLDGVLGGNISLANACVADVTTVENRAKGMGVVGAAFGLGFIVGPAMGGVLAQRYGWWLPPAVAAGLALLNAVCVLAMAEPLPPERRRPVDLGGAVAAELDGVARCFTDPKVGPLLWQRFCFSLTFTVFEQGFGFFSRDILLYSARQSACTLSLFAVAYAVAQGMGVRRLPKAGGPAAVLRTTFLVCAVGYAWLALVQSPAQLTWVLLVLGFAVGVCNTATNAAVSVGVHSGVQGRTFGVSASLGSMSRIIGPILTGWLVQSCGARYPHFACALLSLYAGLRRVRKDAAA